MSAWRKKPRRPKVPQKRLETVVGEMRRRKFYDAMGFKVLSIKAILIAVLQQALRDAGDHEAADALKGAKLVRTSTRQVDETLGQGHCDLAFILTTTGKNPIKVRIQIEVTGYDDPSIAVRSTMYLARGSMQEADWKKRKRCLTPVLSAVVNIGPRLLQASCELGETYGDYGEFKRYEPRHQHIRYDIMEKTPDEILAIPERGAAAVLRMLRIVNEPRTYCTEDNLARVYRLAKGNRQIEMLIFLCIAFRLEGDYNDLALKVLDEEGIGRDTVASMAEILTRKGKAEGIAEGEAKGIAKGKAETLLRQVQQKFAGRISKRREAQVKSAPLEQLDDWLDRVLSAPDMDSLFGGGGRGSRQPQG